MDSNHDEEVVKTKTLDGFDESAGVEVIKGEFNEVGLKNLSSVGGGVTKSQENGEEKGSVLDGNSVCGGGGVSEISTAKNGEVEKVVGVEGVGVGVGDGVCEISTAKNGEVKKVVGVEGVGVGGEIERGGERKGGEFLNGSVDSSKKLSSIARRTRNRAKIEGHKDENVDVDVARKGSGSGDEIEEENPFSVGDFVWGKIKSHPWWPGRIYDPSDASEFALNYKHEGRLLVAYFGDRTFAWCDPSQLKPFEENFEEMSKQSSLKTFATAVKEAENEFGRLVKLQMTCSCAKAKENQRFISFAVNGGIKEGVHVPENGVSGFLAARLDSSTLLADIRRLALFDLLCNSLEQTALKGILLAFYDAKYGYLSTINSDPMSIEDPVDEGGVPTEASLRGPDDKNSLMGLADQELGQNVLRTPLDMQEKGRKSKTVAELLGMDLGDELERSNGTEGGTPVVKSVVKTRKKRKKVSDEDQSFMPEETGNNGSPKAEEQSGKLIEKSALRKRKTIDESQKRVADSTRVTRSSAQKKGGPGKSTTSVKETSETTGDGGKTTSGQKLDTLPRVRKKDISVSINGDTSIEEGYGRISPRERKLSKYLSPPYTIILQRQRSSNSLLESDQAGGLVCNDVAKVGEKVTKEAGSSVGSPQIVKCSAQTFQRSSKSSGSKGDKGDYSDYKTTKQDPISVVVDPMKTIDSLNGVLHEIRSAARNPFDSKRHQSLDTVKGFISSYRSSKYKNGPNYKTFKKRAKNLSGTKHGSKQKVPNEIDQQTPKPKLLKRTATKRDEPKVESKVNHEASCGLSASSSALLMKFPAGFPLPTKDVIVKMFRKFGDLDEAKSELITESSMAKIVFVQSACAVAAMKSMRKSRPFGSVKVNYKTQLRSPEPSTKTKKAGVQNKKKTETSEKIKGAKSKKLENEPLAVISIKKKLEAMTAMLGQTDGKMTQEIKSKLESESKELLKKVKMMTATSS